LADDGAVVLGAGASEGVRVVEEKDIVDEEAKEFERN